MELRTLRWPVELSKQLRYFAYRYLAATQSNISISKWRPIEFQTEYVSIFISSNWTRQTFQSPDNLKEPKWIKISCERLWTRKICADFFFLLKVKWNKDGRALYGFSKYFSSWIPNHNVCPITAGLRMHHSLHSICILHSALCNLDYNSILCDFSASTGMV